MRNGHRTRPSHAHTDDAATAALVTVDIAGDRLPGTVVHVDTGFRKASEPLPPDGLGPTRLDGIKYCARCAKQVVPGYIVGLTWSSL